MKNLRRLTYLFTFFTLCIVGTLQAKEKETFEVIVNQQTEITAVYNGYSVKNGYQFTLDDGTVMLFKTVAPEVLKTFELSSDKIKGSKFKVTYTTDKDEDGKYFTIVGLKKAP